MNLIWLTDIHLNFLEKMERIIFYDQILIKEGDAVLITGDIAEAHSVIEILNEMVNFIKKPIYFVLGNHDYYGGNVQEVRHEVARLSQANSHLIWLGSSGIKFLNTTTILLGQDGWADGQLGDFQNSRVALNDSRLIQDLFQARLLGKHQLLEKMQQLADIDAFSLKKDLKEAVKQKPKQIIILTHVPPFKDACTYKGRISDDNWLPFFSSKAMGDMIVSIAKKNEDINFLVLCGHTHGKADVQILKNLRVLSGGAEYYQPEIQDFNLASYLT